MFRTSALAIALSTLFAFSGAVHAEDPKVTREQVQSDYLKAQKAGKLPPTGEVGVANKVDPSTSNTTRKNVKAELEHAKQDGTVPATGLAGPSKTKPAHALKDHAAGANAAAPKQLSRAEVKAEYDHAKKDGSLPATGLAGPSQTKPAHSLEDHAAGRVHPAK